MVIVTPLLGGPKRIEPLDASTPPAMTGCVGDDFIQVVRPRERLIVFGAGHVCRAVVPIAATVGFDVTVCDDGETGELAAPPIPCDHVIDSFDLHDVQSDLGDLGPSDYVIIITRDHAIDQQLLQGLLPNEALSYLGVIGSQGKIGRFRKRLEARGMVTEDRVAPTVGPDRPRYSGRDARGDCRVDRGQN